MQDPRPVRACRASSYSAYAANDGLNKKSVGDKLPRTHGGGTPCTSTPKLHEQRRANAVEVFHAACDESQCVYLFAYGHAPRKSLVEHARTPRPPPSRITVRAQKEPGQYC